MQRYGQYRETAAPFIEHNGKFDLNRTGRRAERTGRTRGVRRGAEGKETEEKEVWIQTMKREKEHIRSADG